MTARTTTVFVAGSRSITRMDAGLRRRLDNIIEKRLRVLVGDANEAVRAVQTYLHGKDYDLVEVFCAGDHCPNNLGGWPLRTVAATGARRDFSFYATKDRAMADEASHGLMIWDGTSAGTLMNVLRLARRRKPVVVYTVPARRFPDLRNEADWDAFVSRCKPGLRRRITRKAAVEGGCRPD